MPRLNIDSVLDSVNLRSTIGAQWFDEHKALPHRALQSSNSVGNGDSNDDTTTTARSKTSVRFARQFMNETLLDMSFKRTLAKQKRKTASKKRKSSDENTSNGVNDDEEDTQINRKRIAFDLKVRRSSDHRKSVV